MTPTLTAALITTAALTITALLPTTPTTGLHLTTTTGCEDLTGWQSHPNPYPDNRYPLIIGTHDNKGPADLCTIGGNVTGNIPDIPWDQWMTTGGDGTGLRAFVGTGKATINTFRATNVADCLDLHGVKGAGTVVITGTTVQRCRDDAIENDESLNLVVQDSLIEGFVGLSMRGAGTRHDPTGQAPATVLLDRVLLHARADFVACKQGRKAYCTADGRAAHTPFKWSSSTGARNFTVRDTTILIDGPSYSTNTAMTWPVGIYERVTLVWTWPQPYTDFAQLPPGVTVTNDIGVWNNARTKWLTNHPKEST